MPSPEPQPKVEGAPGETQTAPPKLRLVKSGVKRELTAQEREFLPPLLEIQETPPSPVKRWVLWSIIGLVIALPLLTLYADIMGLLGGAIMCYFDLGITFPAFLRELQQSLHVQTLIVGLVKAPVFAFVIALVGCYEGFQVERNAASVGLLTTRSVVEGVFLVIVLDAAFSIMFSVLKI